MLRAIPLGWSSFIGRCRSILKQMVRLVHLIKLKAPRESILYASKNYTTANYEGPVNSWFPKKMVRVTSVNSLESFYIILVCGWTGPGRELN